MMQYEYISGATPLDPDEASGLIPNHITTHNQLNEWEAANILAAEIWLFSTASHDNFLTIEFIKLLHKKMFNDTWEWAGEFRSTEKNIGVAPYHITTKLKNLLEDIRYQIIHCQTEDIEKYDRNIDKIACHFHHRLVAIHPFSNGNGRHARLITDLLLTRAGRPRFTWGKKNFTKASLTRELYIAALRDADKHDYKALEQFVRS